MSAFVRIHDQNNYFLKLYMRKGYAMQIGLRKDPLILL